MEGLTQLHAYGLITGSVCWWIWNQARGIHTFDVNWQTNNHKDVALQLLGINGTGGHSQRTNIHHLQEIVMWFVCSEQVCLKNQSSNVHLQPL